MGFAHPDLLLEQITATQLCEWEAYDRLDPIGKWRDDYHMAYLSMIITNIAKAIHGKSGMKMSEIKEFFPIWDVGAKKEEPEKQSVEEQRAILHQIAMSFKNKKK